MRGDRQSRRIDADSIIRSDKFFKVKHGDRSERGRWIDQHIISDFRILEARRQATDQTLGFIRPPRIQSLQITKARARGGGVRKNTDGRFEARRQSNLGRVLTGQPVKHGSTTEAVLGCSKAFVVQNFLTRFQLRNPDFLFCSQVPVDSIPPME